MIVDLTPANTCKSQTRSSSEIHSLNPIHNFTLTLFVDDPEIIVSFFSLQNSDSSRQQQRRRRRQQQQRRQQKTVLQIKNVNQLRMKTIHRGNFFA